MPVLNSTNKVSRKDLKNFLGISDRAASAEYQRILDVLEIKYRDYLIVSDLVKMDIFPK
jgi:hypothetical protein